MNYLPNQSFACALFAIAFLAGAGAAGQAATGPGPGEIHVEIRDGFVSMQVRDAPLQEVMRVMGEQAGFESILVGDFSDPPRVSLSFERISVREAVERLVGASNRIIIYRPGEDGARQGSISQVWILQSGQGAVGDAGNSVNIASGLEQDVDGYKLASLSSTLQLDNDPAVRARAAIALGAFQDERAVLALELALADDVPQVRAQAIKALGRIGSERASIALGDFLLRGNLDDAERILASRALSNHDSEIARDYLQAGAIDADPQSVSGNSDDPSGASQNQ